MAAAEPKSLRASFLGETAAAISEKAAAAGLSALTAAERVFLTVWNAEAALSQGGVDLAAQQASPGEIAAAYVAIGARRKAAVFIELGKLRPGARDLALDEAFRNADEDPDRLLERFWFAHSPAARAELRRRSADLPGLAWKLVCWTASGWLVGYTLVLSWCALYFAMPYAVFAWGAWGLSVARAASRQCFYATRTRRLVIIFMISMSYVLQCWLCRLEAVRYSRAWL